MTLLKATIGIVIVLMTELTAHTQNLPGSSKGYELYSWREQGRWHYSLHAGTNRAKSYEEITSKEAQLVGTAALKSGLRKVPKGDEVFWRSAAHPGVTKPRSKDAPILELPSGKRIKRIKKFCTDIGVKLTLS